MGRKRIYTLNENYFDLMDTINKHYILGFIYADGSIYKNQLSITVQINDRSVLDFIKNELNYNGPIYIKKNYCTLTITSKIITSKLITIGILPNKTYDSKELPKINSIYYSPFLLGFFDGDGSIYKSSKIKLHEYTANFSCNYDVLTEIKETLYKLGITSSKIRKRHNNDISCMMDIKGSNNLEKLYNLLYSNTPTYFFERKYNKFKDFKNAVSLLSRRKFNEEILNKIYNQYNSGITQANIAKNLNMTPSSIRCVIQRFRKKHSIL